MITQDNQIKVLDFGVAKLTTLVGTSPAVENEKCDPQLACTTRRRHCFWWEEQPEGPVKQVGYSNCGRDAD
jgi:hypothetical protein